jgi:hypothetical protein
VPVDEERKKKLKRRMDKVLEMSYVVQYETVQ